MSTSNVIEQKPKGLTANQFMLNILNGMGIGIVVGLIGNAVVGGLFGWLAAKYGAVYPWVNNLKIVAIATQWCTAPLIGAMIGFNFKFPPLKTGCVALVAYIAAGNVIFKDGGFMVKGLGDILNILFNTALACGLLLLIKDKFGSLAIFLLPIVVGIGVGFVSTLTLGYMKEITVALADAIKYFTALKPWLAGPLIAMVFAFAVSSPLSSVGLAFISGVVTQAAAAANLGVAAAGAYLIVATCVQNKPGVPVALFFGAMKMMCPNLVEKPMGYVMIMIVAAVTGLYGIMLTDISLDTKSAGFGFIALIGPLNAFDNFPAEMSEVSKIVQLVMAYAVVPFATSIVLHLLALKVFRFYKNEDFMFNIG